MATTYLCPVPLALIHCINHAPVIKVSRLSTTQEPNPINLVNPSNSIILIQGLKETGICIGNITQVIHDIAGVDRLVSVETPLGAEGAYTHR